MARMGHPEMPIGAFTAAFLVLLPVSWHWRARNIGTLTIIFWLFAVNFIYGVNSIAWAGNVNNPVPVWCDISANIILGASVALPVATMCICKQLEFISSARNVRMDFYKKRHMVIDGSLCLGTPLVFMALHYVVQGHRFDIVEDFGCQPTTYYSIPSVFIIWVVPLLFSLGTLVYAAMALGHFIRLRASFSRHLAASSTSVSANRYLRLIAMAVTLMVWGTAFTAFDIYSNTYLGLLPWTNWADVHSDFDRADLYPTFAIISSLRWQMFLSWWSMPASAFIFFLFFGFGEDAFKEYRAAFSWIRRTVPRRRSIKGGVNISCTIERRTVLTAALGQTSFYSDVEKADNGFTVPAESSSTLKLPADDYNGLPLAHVHSTHDFTHASAGGRRSADRSMELLPPRQGLPPMVALSGARRPRRYSILDIGAFRSLSR